MMRGCVDAFQVSLRDNPVLCRRKPARREAPITTKFVGAALHGVSRSHRVATLLALPFACTSRHRLKPIPHGARRIAAAQMVHKVIHKV